MKLCFAIRPQWQGWLLRDVLRQCGVSSTLVRAIKRTGGFWLDAAPVHTDARVCAGQELSFLLPPEEPSSVMPQQLAVKIAFESRHALVLDKAAGMAVHPTLNYADGTLANAYMGLLAGRGRTGVFRPVNRLDRDTSGLVLCAQNAFAAPLLASSVKKQYFAIIEGRLPAERGRVDAPIGRAPDSIILRRVSPDGQPSITDYTVLAAGAGHSLVRLDLQTGRTHQIRVHMAHLGHPLAGDDLYGGSRALIARQALHCGRLTFEEPQTGEERCVTSPLPPDMAALAAQMGLTASRLAEWMPV